MKKIVRRIARVGLLSFFLVVILSMNVSMVQAANEKASIGSKKYNTLEEAISKVKNGQTIKLLGNVSIEETIVVKKNVKFTINMNKKTITHKGTGTEPWLQLNRGTLTLKNGTIKSKTDKIGTGIVIEKKASMIIQSGTYGVSIRNNGGNLTIKDANFTKGANISNDKGKCLINKGKFKGSIFNGINFKSNSKGTLTVKNGTFSFISNRAGNCTIYNGKVESIDTSSSKAKTILKKGTYESCENHGTTIIQNGRFVGSIQNYGEMTIKTMTNPGKKNYAGLDIVQGNCVVNMGYFCGIHLWGGSNPGTVTINNAKLIQTANDEGLSGVIQNDGGTLVIKGGSYSLTGGLKWLLINGKDGTTKIEGGDFNTSSDNEIMLSRGIVEITGGTFTSKSDVILARKDPSNKKGKLMITGGTFKSAEGKVLEIVQMYDTAGKLYIPQITIKNAVIYKNKDGEWCNEPTQVTLSKVTFKNIE